MKDDDILCNRSYDGKCSGKTIYRLIEKGSGGLFATYWCQHHKDEVDKEREKLDWEKIKR